MSTQARENTQQANAGQGPRNPPSTRNRHATTNIAKDDEDKYNQPSDKSTDRVLHCATCDVWVPSRHGDWNVHISGIRHRRHVLSFREYGERGRLVLSAFESDPDPKNPSHRIAGKASAAEFGLDQGASGSGGQYQKQRQGGKKKFDPVDRELEAMRTEAKKCCLDIYGSGRIYSKVMENNFTVEQFRNAKSLCDERIACRGLNYNDDKDKLIEQINSLRYSADNPAVLLCIAQQLRQGPEKQQQLSSKFPAAATDAVQDDQEAPAKFLLPPIVILEIDFPDIGSDTLAAWLCSLHSFIHALADHPDNAKRLIFAMHIALFENIDDIIRQGWHRIFRDIESLLLAKNTKLQELRFYLWSITFEFEHPPEIDSEPDEERFSEGMQAYSSYVKAVTSEIFNAKTKETAASCRLAVLMSQHPRLGRCSLLQLLPGPVLQQILEEAVPKSGCLTEVYCIANKPEFKYKPGPWTVRQADHEDAFEAGLGWNMRPGFEHEDKTSEEDEESGEEEEFSSDDSMGS
jgi:hypothetical protein